MHLRLLLLRLPHSTSSTSISSSSFLRVSPPSLLRHPVLFPTSPLFFSTLTPNTMSTPIPPTSTTPTPTPTYPPHLTPPSLIDTVGEEVLQSLSGERRVVGVVVPKKLAGKFVSLLKKSNMMILGTRSVIPHEEDESLRVLLLKEDMDIAGLPEHIRKEVESDGLQTLPQKHVIKVGYETLSCPEVLNRLLPKDLEVIHSFEVIGHIAHFNLTPELLPFKYLIGRIVLDKHKTLKTVITKTSEIDTVFRTFSMEVIGGEESFETEVVESGCKFRFDFSKVYWNSKLGTEHHRLVKSFKKGDVVADMFGGVGPFALPAAKRGLKVYSNDLNPNSIASLRTNISLNKLSDQVTPSCEDGRDFIRRLVGSRTHFDRVIMNLPASAITFIDVFKGLFPADWGKMPTIHCYCFSKAVDDLEADVIKQAEEIFSCSLQGLGKNVLSVSKVRNVAPLKWMMRLNLTLPRSIGCAPIEVKEAGGQRLGDGEPPLKRLKKSG
eukprot:TRINITY_DN1112_c4_g1_i1.p1 TRINITY_DN1112_c4_g1~~TRINITY_DN1112_c4_g1_i1.p1  ORF type:complete len:493 (-),score=110.78 TRINITY_DN1112_c4_g1_i1:51-1529(-)